MDRQAVYDRVKAHLLAQGRRALLPENHPDRMPTSPNCAYRADNGDRCAVGCLISDEHYSPELETRGLLFVSSSVPRALAASLGCELTEGDLSFLRALQAVHDEQPADTWGIHLGNVANAFGLVP